MEAGSWVCHQPWVVPLYTHSAEPFHLGRAVGGDPLALQDIAMGSVLLLGSAVEVRPQDGPV